MNELPMLFSGSLPQAILDDMKTLTRRLVKPQRHPYGHMLSPDQVAAEVIGMTCAVRCPYGQPGDRIYVKETFWAWGRWETRFDPKKGRDAWHFVDMTRECGKEYLFEQPAQTGTRRDMTPAWHKRPSIFMPRHASRITLEIVSVRVERLQEISEADAKAEGVRFTDFGTYTPPGTASLDGGKTHHPFKPRQHPGYHVSDVNGPDQCHQSASGAFAGLWASINGPESWAANPWVWVVKFKRVEQARAAA